MRKFTGALLTALLLLTTGAAAASAAAPKAPKTLLLVVAAGQHTYMGFRYSPAVFVLTGSAGINNLGTEFGAGNVQICAYHAISGGRVQTDKTCSLGTITFNSMSAVPLRGRNFYVDPVGGSAPSTMAEGQWLKVVAKVEDKASQVADAAGYEATATGLDEAANLTKLTALVSDGLAAIGSNQTESAIEAFWGMVTTNQNSPALANLSNGLAEETGNTMNGLAGDSAKQILMAVSNDNALTSGSWNLGVLRTMLNDATN